MESRAAGGGPGSLPAELPVSIHFRGSWNTDDGKAQVYEEGSCTVHAYGKMVKLGADSPFYAHYVPAGVVASFTYSETIIARPYDGKGPCKGVVGRVSGSGTADVTEGVELGKGSLFLQAFSGPLGIGAAMQAAGDPSLADVETLLEDYHADEHDDMRQWFSDYAVQVNTHEEALRTLYPWFHDGEEMPE